jgi:hypothetical protein
MPNAIPLDEDDTCEALPQLCDSIAYGIIRERRDIRLT